MRIRIDVVGVGSLILVQLRHRGHVSERGKALPEAADLIPIGRPQAEIPMDQQDDRVPLTVGRRGT